MEHVLDVGYLVHSYTIYRGLPSRLGTWYLGTRASWDSNIADYLFSMTIREGVPGPGTVLIIATYSGTLMQFSPRIFLLLHMRTHVRRFLLIATCR